MSVRAVLLLVALFVAAASAAHVCKNKDCSDVVGEHLVKDNLGKSHHFHQRHHDDWKEEARLRRIEILRREKNAM
jgi:hypothetical protein